MQKIAKFPFNTATGGRAHDWLPSKKVESYG